MIYKNSSILQNITWKLFIPKIFFLFLILLNPTYLFAQNSRPSPTPRTDIPSVISRDSDSEKIESDDDDVNEITDSNSNDNTINITRQNTTSKVNKEDETSAKQKKMLLYLDLLTRTEQREASLQKQLFDMLEKQNSLNSKIKQLENQMRPESILSATSLTGSLRPEDLREQRKQALTLERDSAVNLLQRVESRITTLESSVRKAEALVERIRLRFDKVMDEALNEEELLF